MSNENDINGKAQAIAGMAQTYLWRAEVEKFHFIAVITVLEGMGYLNETTVSDLMDVADDLYPESKFGSPE